MTSVDLGRHWRVIDFCPALLAFARAAWCARFSASAPGWAPAVDRHLGPATGPAAVRATSGPSPEWTDPVGYAVAVFVVALIVLSVIAQAIGGAGARLGARRRRPHAGAGVRPRPGRRAGRRRLYRRRPGDSARSLAASRCCRPRSLPYVYSGADWAARQIAAGNTGRRFYAPPPARRDHCRTALLHATPQARRAADRRHASTRNQEIHRWHEFDRDAADDEPTTMLHEECGVFGVWNVPDAAAVTALGLHALQHRGQEATGIVTFDGDHFHSHRGLGLVGDNFSDATGDRPPAGQHRGRPQPLRHHRRHHPAQRAAAVCRFRVRRLRGGAQRQPDQRPRAAPRPGAPRLPVPVHHRLRGVHPPDRHQPVFHRGGPADRRA